MIILVPVQTAVWASRVEAFTREQLLTGVTVVGGNVVPPTTPPADHRDDVLCLLLGCLLKDESLGRFLAQHNIDAAALERCVRICCDSRNTAASARDLAEREGVETLPESNVLGQLRAMLARPEFADVMRKIAKDLSQ